MKLYAAAERDSKQLPEVQRPQFMESHKARFEQFMKSQPSRKPSVQQVAPPSAAAIATAQQGGQRPPVAQHSTLASVPAGRARIDNSAVPSRGAKVFSKFRSFKRGC